MLLSLAGQIILNVLFLTDYKSHHKIIVLYVLIFTLLGRRR